MNKLVVLLLLLSNVPCLADEPAIAINKGDKAPFTGLLLSPSQAQDVKNNSIQLSGLTSVNKSLNLSLTLQDDIITHKDDQIKTLMTQNDSLTKNLYSERSMSDLEKIGWFGLGVIATGLAVYGVKNLSH